MWQPCNRHHRPLHPGLYCGNTTLPIELLERKEKKSVATPISILTGFSLNCKKWNGVIFLPMTQTSRSQLFTKK